LRVLEGVDSGGFIEFYELRTLQGVDSGLFEFYELFVFLSFSSFFFVILAWFLRSSLLFWLGLPLFVPFLGLAAFPSTR
jgi:hypothetical protein